MFKEINGLQFGEFVLLCEDEVLICEGKPVPLTPKAYLLLKTLVENQGRIMEKQELLDAIWPDSFVEEGNLPYTVNLLRKALGDSKSDPLYIETVPRRGYRFFATVTPFTQKARPEGDVESPVSESFESAARKKTRNGPAILATAATIVIAMAASIWWFAAPKSARGYQVFDKPFSVEQLSTSGNSRVAAISPDGKYAVYSDVSGGKESLWLRNIDGSENVQIVPPSEDEYLSLRFSGRGKSIYFIRKPGDVHALPALYRVEMFGGVPVKVMDDVNRSVDLSFDDSQMAFSRCRYRKDDFCAVMVASGDGTNERKILSTESGVHVRSVRFSPTAESVAVALGRYLTDRNDSRVVEINLKSNVQRDLTSERFAEVSGVEWLPDETGILFTASDFKDGKSSIFVSIDGKTERVSRDASSYETLSSDRQGSRLLAVQYVPDYPISVVDDGTVRKLGVARDLTTLPNGKIFYSTFDGEIWSVNEDGSDQRQLTSTKSAESSVRVSPDGRSVFFSTEESGNRQVWRMNADGTDRKQLTAEVGGYPLTVTADGSYLFYESTLDGYVYRVATSGGKEAPIYNEKRLFNPSVSPDGNLVAYLFNDALVRKIGIMNLSSRQNLRVVELGEGQRATRHFAWSADGKALYFATATASGHTLWRQPLSVESPEEVAELGQGDLTSISSPENGNLAYIIGRWRNDVMLLRGLQ